MNIPLSGRLRPLLDALEAGLVERRQSVRLCLLAALAGEHCLLIGPPGTAKSELARRLHSAFANARYFERLLTRFTVPEELFGPLSLKALEQDRYERHTDGFLPTASIAFIDEVFKANSAILNALLTLLNERAFDNGAGRLQCPLISVIGATNEVPEDEIADAFFDRFLLRLPLQPVSSAGFSRLLEQGSASTWQAPAPGLALQGQVLADLTQAARQVRLPAAVLEELAGMRAWVAAQGLVVSDRRWVKIVGLLRVAAASEGRAEVLLWDLLLLPWLTAPDAERQSEVADWLAQRLGVREAFSPARLTQAVQAFERQLDNERHANDLDYDERGRLKFSATEIAAEIGDAKGGAAALRMQHSRKRRYGHSHIQARLDQLDALQQRCQRYAGEVGAHRASLQAFAAGSLWLDPGSCARALAHLSDTATAVTALAEQLERLRDGYLCLPRLAQDNGVVPEPLALHGLDLPEHSEAPPKPRTPAPP